MMENLDSCAYCGRIPATAARNHNDNYERNGIRQRSLGSNVYLLNNGNKTLIFQATLSANMENNYTDSFIHILEQIEVYQKYYWIELDKIRHTLSQNKIENAEELFKHRMLIRINISQLCTQIIFYNRTLLSQESKVEPLIISVNYFVIINEYLDLMQQNGMSYLLCLTERSVPKGEYFRYSFLDLYILIQEIINKKRENTSTDIKNSTYWYDYGYQYCNSVYPSINIISENDFYIISFFRNLLIVIPTKFSYKLKKKIV